MNNVAATLLGASVRRNRESVPGATTDPESVKARIERSESTRVDGTPDHPTRGVDGCRITYDDHSEESRALFVELANEIYPG